uniref:GntR family transcriptional regulator n=1 Tax=Pectobacterium versatile TaxID=2488639 RepID=A0A855MII3_9GAMM|nr:GntR family transcriptional regulator [Pectobacterium versatile]
MSRSQNLRHNVINQIIDDMARGHIPSPLPSQNALAEMYNISRTTVRHILFTCVTAVCLHRLAAIM